MSVTTVRLSGPLVGRIKGEARLRGMKMYALAELLLREGLEPKPPAPDPLWEFLHVVLEVCYSDHFRPGPTGWEIDEADYAKLPESVKRLVQSAELVRPGVLGVRVVSKDWAMRVAAESYLRADEA